MMLDKRRDDPRLIGHKNLPQPQIASVNSSSVHSLSATMSSNVTAACKIIAWIVAILVPLVVAMLGVDKYFVDNKELEECVTVMQSSSRTTEQFQAEATDALTKAVKKLAGGVQELTKRKPAVHFLKEELSKTDQILQQLGDKLDKGVENRGKIISPLLGICT